MTKSRMEEKGMSRKHDLIKPEVKSCSLYGLSTIAGSKLTKGNACISDLCDADRPMKIAELYSEVLHNEWEDALEELLENGATDDHGINILLEIVTEAFEFCSNAANKYHEGMLQSATCLPNLSSVHGAANTNQNIRQLQRLSPEDQFSQECIQLSDEQKQGLYGLRKSFTSQLLPKLQKQYNNKVNAILLHHFRGNQYSFTPQRTVVSSVEQEMSYCRSQNGRERTETKTRTNSDRGSLSNRADQPSTFDDVIQQRPDHFNTLKQPQQADNLCETDFIYTFVTRPSEYNQCTSPQYSKVQSIEEYTITTTKDHGFDEEATRISTFFENTTKLANTCVHLCWLMVIKNPPLAMIFDVPKGSKMNTDWFEPYKQSGNLVKFVVWPALFLHKEGALLAKGVAQPMSKAEEQSYACSDV